MASLRDQVEAEAKNRGGQPHRLPKLLARLAPDIADDVRALLADEDTNFPTLARIMADEYGCTESLSTWTRWGRDWRAGKTF